jgi:diguanylate cyclase (GGDEF)-like protein
MPESVMLMQCMETASLIKKLTYLQASISEIQQSVKEGGILQHSWNSVSALVYEIDEALADLRHHRLLNTVEIAWEEKAALLQLQRQVRQQKQLNQILQAIHQSLELSAIFTTLIEHTRTFFQADWSLLVQYDAQQQHWRQVPQGDSPVPAMSCLTLPETELNWVSQFQAMQSQVRPLQVNRATQQQSKGYQIWLHQFPGSWLLLPIFLPAQPAQNQVGQLWGLMALGYQRPDRVWEAAQVEFAQTIGQAVAIAIHQSLLYQKLQEANEELQALASTDSLTQLANRRQFDRHLEAEWQRLTREQRPLSLILCDIDYFKPYNDCYGHPTGDQCLTQVAQALTQTSRRPADLVARYGGEEFAVILPNTDTQGAYKVAYSMRQELAALAIPHEASSVSEYITLTMGIATIIPSRDSSPQDLLQAADLALYHAKQQGRDRIYVHALYTYPPNQGDDG